MMEQKFGATIQVDELLPVRKAGCCQSDTSLKDCKCEVNECVKSSDEESSGGWFRRKVVGLIGAMMAAIGTLVLNRKLSAQEESEKQGEAQKESNNGHTPKWGMVIDLDKCTGCGACVVACAVENNMMLGDANLAEQDRVIRWIHLLPLIEGEHPNIKARLLPMLCQHCDDPPCIYVCPVTATYKNPEGLVAQVYPRCIGCRYCVNNCPYTIKYFNWSDPVFPQPIPKGFNPDVAVRYKGIVEKCTFCHHRLQIAREKAKAEGREFKAEDYVPACVEACPAKAIYFGDLNDPESEVSKLAHSRRAFKLLEELGTDPKVIYLSEG
ncbi:MAG: sulfate reduction electron transfer complex DsrMKJOP subunit DsrO [Armatimonadota bacterium]